MVIGTRNFEIAEEISRLKRQVFKLSLKPFKSTEDKAQLRRLKERIFHLELQKMIQY